MKPENQTIQLAKLDDNLGCDEKEDGYYPFKLKVEKDYLHSRDAIVPLIEKQNYTIKARIIRFLQPVIEWDIFGVTNRVVIQELEKLLLATPQQLCEALLRACGKWEE